jgi:hypothetical protein
MDLFYITRVQKISGQAHQFSLYADILVIYSLILKVVQIF